jgi:hypothetical protein
MSGSLIQQYTQQPQQQSGGSLLIPQYTQPQSGGLLNIKSDPGYWGGTGVNTPKPAVQQAAAAPAAAQQQPPQWGTPNGMSPNAQAQDWMDRYAKTLTGAPFASLGNGPIDPGALMLLGQMNPDLAAQYYTGPYSPWGGGGGGGGGGYSSSGGSAGNMSGAAAAAQGADLTSGGIY